MKDVIKRWNELAGTNKSVNESKEPRIAAHDLLGNEFLKGLLNEDAGEFRPDLDENVDEDLGDALADKAEESGGDKEGGDEDEDAELGDDEKPTLSNSELVKGLKTGAAAIADAIPNSLNDEFADVMNSVKDMASDKQKMLKLIKYIEKIR
tara:strand:- start:20 stop:472 length:453 start_codon:yes stop_codon:yes gene_type:complete